MITKLGTELAPTRSQQNVKILYYSWKKMLIKIKFAYESTCFFSCAIKHLVSKIFLLMCQIFYKNPTVGI